MPVLARDAMPTPVKVILDTDMGGGGCQDCDDVGTLAIANALADSGEVELLAVVLNTRAAEAAKTIGVLQRYYGRENVPVGIYRPEEDSPDFLTWAHPYTKLLSQGWESGVEMDDLPSSVEVYRRTLAAQPDHSVVVVSVGTLTNLAGLLKSGADAHSSLTGADLLTSKVSRLAIMGGRYPSGAECNFMECDPWENCDWVTRSSAFVADQLPRSLEVIYVGQEIGFQIMHGGALSYCAPETSPVRAAYVEFLGGPYRDRFSWDPLTLLVGVRGASAVTGISNCDGCSGRVIVHPLGHNEWENDARANQRYVNLTSVPERLKGGGALDSLLCQTPVGLFSDFGRLPKPPKPADVVCLTKPSVEGLPALPDNVVNEVTECDPWEPCEAGVYGGTCTCPDGQTYQVGDSMDVCGSLACIGGVSGVCEKHEGPWSRRSVRCAPLEVALPLTVYAAQPDGPPRARAVPLSGRSEPVCIRRGAPICFGIGSLSQTCLSATTDWLTDGAVATLPSGMSVTWNVELSHSLTSQASEARSPSAPPPPADSQRTRASPASPIHPVLSRDPVAPPRPSPPVSGSPALRQMPAMSSPSLAFAGGDVFSVTRIRWQRAGAGITAAADTGGAEPIEQAILPGGSPTYAAGSFVALGLEVGASTLLALCAMFVLVVFLGFRKLQRSAPVPQREEQAADLHLQRTWIEDCADDGDPVQTGGGAGRGGLQ